VPVLRRITNGLVRRLAVALERVRDDVSAEMLPRFASSPRNLHIGMPRTIVNPGRMFIGDDVWLGPNTQLIATTAYPGRAIRRPEGGPPPQTFDSRLTIGSRVTATYGDLVLATDSAELAALTFEGLAARLSDFTLGGSGSYACTAPATTLSSTLVSFLTKDPGATVTVNGGAASGSGRVSIPAGKSTIRVDVTAKDGKTKQSYILTVNRGTQTHDPSDASRYSVAVAAAEGGTISLSHSDAEPGATVSISVTPNVGYALNELKVVAQNGSAVALTETGGGYTFVMPESSVTVSATFWKGSFSDVRATDWFADAVKYVSERGLMGGVGGGLFAPYTTTTRAMIVTILHRLDGGRPVTGANPFSDVAEGNWYTDAVTWAAANGIVAGYGGGLFGPGDTITREQLAVILYNYAKFKGIAPVGAWAVELTYPDREDISPWAGEAAMYCQLKGFMQGDENGNLNPLSGTLRCEIAMILMRFIEATGAEN
jgi:hypothetical protein